MVKCRSGGIGRHTKVGQFTINALDIGGTGFLERLEAMSLSVPRISKFDLGSNPAQQGNTRPRCTSTGSTYHDPA